MSFNPKDQIGRYIRWWKDGHMSSTGRDRCLPLPRRHPVGAHPRCNQNDFLPGGDKVIPAANLLMDDFDLVDAPRAAP
jgi:hypothetical protein